MTPCNHDWLSGTNPVIQGTVWICSKCKLCTVNDGGIPVIIEEKDPSRVDWEKMEPGSIIETELHGGAWYIHEWDPDDDDRFVLPNKHPIRLPDRPDLSVWVPWRGGECPVSKLVEIVVMYNDSSRQLGYSFTSSLWEHTGSTFIIAYMVLKTCPECIADMGRGG